MTRPVLHVFTVPLSLIFIRGQAAFMRDRGYALSAVCSPGAALDAYAADEAVPVHAVPMARRITPAGDAVALGRLVELMRRLRPRIVHAHTPKGGLLGTTAARLAGVPVRVYHLRGLPLATARGVSRVLLEAAERTSFGLSTHVLGQSASLRDEVVRRGLVAPSKIRVLGPGSNGVDVDGRYDPSRVDAAEVRALRARLGLGDGPVIGFVGRLVRDKGIVELAAAWARLRERFPGAHLLVAGMFEERDAVPAEVRRALEEDPRVHVAGFVADVRPYYAAMDVLAFPSHREGFPNAPLEAAAMRVPVVGAAATGTVDAIVDGVTGALVPVGDAAALGAALETYLADPQLARRHGEAARARVEQRFRRELVWKELADFYDAALGPEPSPSWTGPGKTARG